MRARAIAIMQPVYLPWLGYFEQIARADHFVFYDTAQYTKQDWRNRNRIAGAGGPIWLTVPVRRVPLGTPIRDIEIDNRHRWANKHLKSIRHVYASAAHFEPCFGELRDILEREWSMLAGLDIALVQALSGILGISTNFSRASEAPSDPDFAGTYAATAEARRNMRLIELCRHHGARVFYVGARAADYIDRDRFAKFGIEVVFQDYRHPVYRQARAPFQSHLAAIDLLMNAGPEARNILLSSPPPAFAEPRSLIHRDDEKSSRMTRA